MSTSRRVPAHMPAPAPDPPPPPQPQRRRSVAHVVEAAQRSALRISVHGPEKIGKSTWAAAAPSPVFFSFDGGVGDLGRTVKVFPKAETLGDVLGDVRSLIEEPHPFETLVLDGMTYLERLIWEHLCALLGWKSIEDPPYMQGLHRAVDELRNFLKLLERLQDAKGMHVVFLGHTTLRTVKRQTAGAFDRQVMTMDSRAAGLLASWVDVTMFAEFGIVGPDGRRVRHLRTEQDEELQAGNRFYLPDPLPLKPAATFWAEVDAWRTDPIDLAAMAIRLAELLGPDAVAHATAETERVRGDKRGLLDLRRALQRELAANNLDTEEDKERS